jgi:diguanylate cyclase (GGDEF)-like protein
LNIPHAASPVAPYQTISIGVASLIPKNDLSVESLMDQADNALYKAKRYGRNQFQIWDGQSAKRHKSKTANAT